MRHRDRLTVFNSRHTANLLKLLFAALIPLSSFAQVEIQETANKPKTINETSAVSPGENQAVTGATSVATMVQPTPAAAFFQQSRNVGTTTPPSGTAKEKRKKIARSIHSEPSTISPATGALAGMPNEESATSNLDRVVFHRTPVQVAMRTGKERVLHFQNPVTLNVPEDMLPFLSQPDIIGRSIYLTASMPFPRFRVVVQDLVTGQLIPLDLQASKDATVSNELEIYAATDKARSNVTGAKDDGEADNDAAPDMVALTRYASHMLYAPRRLMTPVAGIRQVKVSVKPVIGLYRAALVETTPMGQWRSQDHPFKGSQFTRPSLITRAVET